MEEARVKKLKVVKVIPKEELENHKNKEQKTSVKTPVKKSATTSSAKSQVPTKKKTKEKTFDSKKLQEKKEAVSNKIFILRRKIVKGIAAIIVFFQKKKEAWKEKKEKPRKKKRKLTKKERVISVIKTIFFTGLVTGLCGTGVVFLVLYSWCQDIPTINVNELKQSALTSYIYDANGELLTTYSSSENRKWVEIEDVPQTLLDAFISVEDKRFYTHGGVDAKRFLSALLGQIAGSGDHGGSTITQQLIKNVYLSNEVTYKRKIQEIILAFDLEKQMSKNEILEAYINIVYFGSSNYGVAAAAEDYFGKEVDELSLREMAMLAGLTKNPNGYNPRRNTYVKKDMTKTDERTDTVLWTMKENGVITEKQYQMALADDVEVKESSNLFEMYDYAHAVEYAVADVVDDLIEYYGLENNYENRIQMENEIRKGGYSIYTTIDPSVQESLENTISEYDKYPYIYDSKKQYIQDEDGYLKPEVASVVMDPDTGHIIAMVGSREKVTSMKTLNRAITSNMPVASTIKPLSVFAPTIEAGEGPASVTYNFKTKVDGYDNITPFPGGTSPNKEVTIREAVIHSYNVAAARFLCKDVGYDKSEDYLLQLGVSKQNISKTGSGLALGTSGINILELTAAYQSLANGGYYYEPKAYTKVIDKDGNILLDSKNYQISRHVFSEETAWLMTDILKETVEDGTAVNASIKGVETAGKTGTHEDKCAVFAGYTGDYVSCLWIGSDSYSSLSDASGGRIAAPLWKAYMQNIYDAKGIEESVIYDEKPEKIGEAVFCRLSGQLANNGCTDTFKDYLNTDEEPELCEMHSSVNVCAYSGKLAGDSCPAGAISSKSLLFIPADSDMATLPEEIIRQYYPSAYLENFDSICNSHINGINVPSIEQISYAKGLLTKIDGLRAMETLPVEHRAVLDTVYPVMQNYIARAENAVNGITQEGEGFYGEFFSAYDNVKQQIANAQAAVDAIASIPVQ